MSCLMKKLEQLNLDIEEALSAGSSPSSTPSTKRHKQLVRTCVSYDMFLTFSYQMLIEQRFSDLVLLLGRLRSSASGVK